MEKKQNKLFIWIIVIGIITVVLSCGVGAIAGALTGYLAGHKATELSLDRDFDWSLPPDVYDWPDTMPMPDEPSDELPVEPFGQDLPDLGAMVPDGAMVIEVTENSPAEQAGLQTGDVIIEVEGIALDSASLSKVILEYEPGDKIEMLVWRAGEEIEIDARLRRDPDKGGETPWLGLTYRDISGFSFRRGRD